MGLVVGITGVSRAGKSTLAGKISKAFYGKCNILSMDDWPMPENAIPKIKNTVDWESPRSIDFPGLHQAVLESKSRFELTLVEGILIHSYRPLALLIDRNLEVYIPRDIFDQRKRADRRWKIPPWYVDHIWQSYYKYQVPANTRKISGISPVNTSEIMEWILRG